MHFTVWNAVLKVIVLRTALCVTRVAVNFYKSVVYHERQVEGARAVVGASRQSESIKCRMRRSDYSENKGGHFQFKKSKTLRVKL